MLALSWLKGSSTDISWPNESCGQMYGSNLMNVQGTGPSTVADYYDKLAEDYDDAVRAWGYYLPEAVTEALMKHAGLQLPSEDVTLLDLGCGNGLCGQSLFRKGLKHIVGMDISAKSLEVAKNRNCYRQLTKADLLEPLPLEASTFDYLICVGTTSYLESRVFDDWLRVVKVGGVICFTVKSSKCQDWDPAIEALEVEGRWKEMWSHPGIPYLPSINAGEGLGSEMVKIYVYRKIN